MRFGNLFEHCLHSLHETDEELDDSRDVDPGGEAEVQAEYRSDVEDSLCEPHHH